MVHIGPVRPIPVGEIKMQKYFIAYSDGKKDTLLPTMSSDFVDMRKH